jgi:hypothetical protein
MAPRLELLPFRFRDARTGKWTRARYVAELHEIKARYAQWEIIGPAEIRDVNPDARYFHPLVGAAPGKPRPVKEQPKNPPRDPKKDPPVKEPPDEDPETLDSLERFLLRVFLRRYVTYCARRRSFAAMQGAARLLGAVRAVQEAVG